MSTFDEVEARAWSRHGTDEFVGSGYVKIAVARYRTSDRLPELFFYHKEKRISREKARELVERWDRDEAALRASIGRGKP